MLLTETLPSFADEVEELLKKEGHVGLAAQVSGLKIVDRCRCGDDFCASFYTEPKPQGAYGAGHRCVELEPTAGMLILDVVADKIVHVEVLHRHDIREKLARVSSLNGAMRDQNECRGGQKKRAAKAARREKKRRRNGKE